MQPSYSYHAKVLRIVDGDTLRLDVDLGMYVHIVETVRLLGVNTPETYGVKKDSEEYAKGMVAKAWLIGQLETNPMIDDDEFVPVRIRTHKDAKGKYGRYLVELYVGDDPESINTKLIHMGYGAEY